ncbi:hypothetical protein G6F16_003078 [Rhizopus arrhizus]|nr:hypothetical protein G6F23_001262 [Rhizopus arrhizus]KAG0793242.1 hypothetical protein G6F21_003764 [Rhizopus arrhizus]KAG0800765.1 hypothetical protein G6F22_001909 [Rhizopus arrhizus]KAG0814483.1 hypothetical protein G6F20_004738 [Rhizopus arrhizus]KAG0837461.1 hypothetical protein G6F18_004904 [Rhizopus arrhizus]
MSYNYTHDNSSEESKLSRRDDESFYSARSVFSTSSRLSKIPNVVKSSVKNILGREARIKSCVKKHILTTSRSKNELLRTSNLFQNNRLIQRAGHDNDNEEETRHIIKIDNKSSILQQLAHNKRPMNNMADLYYQLTNECDDIKYNINKLTLIPNIIDGIHQMMEMIKDKNKIGCDVQQSNKRIQELLVNINDNNTMTAIQDIISDMKQIMNECVCEYYKEDKLMVIPYKGYRIEDKNNLSSTIPTTIEHMDKDAYWYRDHFMNNPTTCHFIGYHHNDPIFISAVVEYIHHKKHYRIIYRSQKDRVQRKIIRDSFLLNEPSCDTLDDIPDTTWKTVIETNFDLPFHSLKKMTDDVLVKNGLDQELLKSDECALQNEYKFGVFLIKEGQTREEEWLANEHDSPLFQNFLDIIGTRQDLKDYKGYTGKLGTECEITYVNKWHEHIVAYHVSTLIPSNPGDRQQIGRKKYIGNEGNQPFNPSAITSQMQHVFIVVRQEQDGVEKFWRVEVVAAEDVPPFGPPLPDLFDNADDLSEFILTKLINAEYAALKAPKLVHMTTIAGEQLLPHIVEKGWKILEEMDRTVCCSSDSCSTASSSNCSSSCSSKKRSHIKATSSISSFSTHTSIKSSTVDSKVEQQKKGRPTESDSNGSNSHQQTFKQRFFTIPGLRKKET